MLGVLQSVSIYSFIFLICFKSRVYLFLCKLAIFSRRKAFVKREASDREALKINYLASDTQEHSFHLMLFSLAYRDLGFGKKQIATLSVYKLFLVFPNQEFP